MASALAFRTWKAMTKPVDLNSDGALTGYKLFEPARRADPWTLAVQFVQACDLYAGAPE